MIVAVIHWQSQVLNFDLDQAVAFFLMPGLQGGPLFILFLASGSQVRQTRRIAFFCLRCRASLCIVLWWARNHRCNISVTIVVVLWVAYSAIEIERGVSSLVWRAGQRWACEHNDHQNANNAKTTSGRFDRPSYIYEVRLYNSIRNTSLLLIKENDER